MTYLPEPCLLSTSNEFIITEIDVIISSNFVRPSALQVFTLQLIVLFRSSASPTHESGRYAAHESGQIDCPSATLLRITTYFRLICESVSGDAFHRSCNSANTGRAPSCLSNQSTKFLALVDAGRWPQRESNRDTQNSNRAGECRLFIDSENGKIGFETLGNTISYIATKF